MRIAAARLEDLEEVLRLEREVVEAPHWALAEYEGMLTAGCGPLRRCLLVTWEGAALVGYAVGKAAAGEAELESLAVSESWRRAGVGRALCLAVMAWAWEQGAARMELEVRASSAGAIKLYVGLGFVEVGRRTNYYAEPVEDAVLMTLQRDAGL